MEFLTIILFVGLIVSFVMWGYFAVQALRNKQPIWKMLVALVAVQIFKFIHSINESIFIRTVIF